MCFKNQTGLLTMQLYKEHDSILKWKEKKSNVTYDQVWWLILAFRALHYTSKVHTQQWTHTHSSEHTHIPWTHTRSSGHWFMLRRPGSSWGFGALLKGTSVVVLRVERVLYIHSPPPHLQFLLDRDSNSQPFDYESVSLTIRPRLPHRCFFCCFPFFYPSVETIRTVGLFNRVDTPLLR